MENISNWSAKQVVNWFQGLDDSLQCYISNLEETSITGAQLLALSYEDLNNLGITCTGHQELVLEAVDLLKQLYLGLDTENLQTHALDLYCRCRALRSSVTSRRQQANGIAGEDVEALRRGSSIALLRLAADVLESAKLLIMWLDRPPFLNSNDLKGVRASFVKLGYELSTTMQQTVFACVIEDAALAICKEMEVSTNQLIVSSDPMTIQPSALEVAHLINRDNSSGLGLFIKATFEGHLVITGTKEGSVSSRIRRIAAGDEVVAVSGQTVIGWQLSKLVATLKSSPHDIAITLKKRPAFANTSVAVTPAPRRQQAERVLTVPPPISPIRKVTDSRKNSLGDPIEVAQPEQDPVRHITSQKIEDIDRKWMKNPKRMPTSTLELNTSESSGGNSSRTSFPQNSPSSFDSSRGGSLSSREVNFSSSSGCLHGQMDGRKRLPHVSARERPSNQHGSNGMSRQVTGNVPRVTMRCKSLGNIKPERRSLDGSLNDSNSNRIRKVARARPKSQSLIESKSIWYDEQRSHTPSSPLDFLQFPPPPKTPYSPTVDDAMQLAEKAMNSSANRPSENASRSRNSLLDMERNRRFTVIGDKEMDEKWYKSLLAEIDLNKVKLVQDTEHMSEVLDKRVPSEDSVFTSLKRSMSEEASAVLSANETKAQSETFSWIPSISQTVDLKHVVRPTRRLCDLQWRVPPFSTGSESGGSELKNAEKPGSGEASGTGYNKHSVPPVKPSAKPRTKSLAGNLNASSRKPAFRAGESESACDAFSPLVASERNQLLTTKSSPNVLQPRNNMVPPTAKRRGRISSASPKGVKVMRQRSSRTERGSYIAAIDVGYAFANVRRNGHSGINGEGAENYHVKLAGGVRMQLQKDLEKGRQKNHLRSQDHISDMRSHRRISCRDLGQGECDGWLWKKKTNTNSPLSSKWTKRWVVLKDIAVYCYRTEGDEKAESYIELPGYEITPAPDKKKKYAFRVFHPQRKTFYFASDRLSDMSRWMNKMGLVAIRAFPQDKPVNDGNKPYYSESESEDASVHSKSPNKPSLVNDASPSREAVAKRRLNLEDPLSRSLEAVNLQKFAVDEVHHAKSEEELRHQKTNETARMVKKLPSPAKSPSNAPRSAAYSFSQETGMKQRKEKGVGGPVAAAHKVPGGELTQDVAPTTSRPPGYQAGMKVAEGEVAELEAVVAAHGDMSEDTRDKDCSINDLCKALQKAEVDIHGVKRTTTLRRKMTMLSRDPRKNDLMLKKRALHRQMKALLAELEYYDHLLSKTTLSSEQLHSWINEHPSLVADLGTIRRMSRTKKKPVATALFEIEEGNSAVQTPVNITENKENAPSIRLQSPLESSEIIQHRPNTKLASAPDFVQRHLNVPPPVYTAATAPGPQHNPDALISIVQSLPKVRPRSSAFSNHERTIESRRRPVSPSKPYLETDL